MLQSLKKTLQQIMRYKLVQFWDAIRPKLPIWPIGGFIGKSHLKDFYVLALPYQVFKKLQHILKNSIKYQSSQTHTHKQTN